MEFQKDSVQSFAYEIKNGAVTIYRCFSGADEAVIPETIEGYPVRNLAPYAFSEHQDPRDLLNKKISAGSESADPMHELPALAGLSLVSLVLPDTVQRLGRYCLYNCENLKNLEFSGSVKDWGTGTFTGCREISSMKVHVVDEGTSSLKDILSDVTGEVEVDYVIRSSVSEEVVHTRLMFPEYYEEGTENTPARLLGTKIHGTGMRYRNCFQQKIFQFQEYDSWFIYAVTEEKTRTVIRLALDRLIFPGKITPEAAAEYRKYLLEQVLAAAEYLLEEENQEQLSWLMNLIMGQECDWAQETKLKKLEEIRTMAGRMGKIGAVSYLMDLEHRFRPKKERKARSSRFEL